MAPPHAIIMERIHEVQSKRSKEIITALVKWVTVLDAAPKRVEYRKALLEISDVVANGIPPFVQIACGYSADTLIALSQVPESEWDLVFWCIGLILARCTDLCVGTVPRTRGRSLGGSIAEYIDKKMLALIRMEIPGYEPPSTHTSCTIESLASDGA